MNTSRTLVDAVLRQHFVILDTETTGLKQPAQVIQIGIIDWHGDTLLDTYVFARDPLPKIITDITGIKDSDVEHAPLWEDVKKTILEIVQGKDIITYNAKFDRYMLHCSDDTFGLARTEYGTLNQWFCAMLWYANIHADYDQYHGNNRWVKLQDACKLEGVIPDGAHTAIQDCRSTYALIRATMARLADE